MASLNIYEKSTIATNTLDQCDPDMCGETKMQWAPSRTKFHAVSACLSILIKIQVNDEYKHEVEPDKYKGIASDSMSSIYMECTYSVFAGGVAGQNMSNGHATMKKLCRSTF